MKGFIVCVLGPCVWAEEPESPYETSKVSELASGIVRCNTPKEGKGHQVTSHVFLNPALHQTQDHFFMCNCRGKVRLKIRGMAQGLTFLDIVLYNISFMEWWCSEMYPSHALDCTPCDECNA